MKILLALFTLTGILLVASEAVAEETCGGCCTSDPVFVQRDFRQVVNMGTKLGQLRKPKDRLMQAAARREQAFCTEKASSGTEQSVTASPPARIQSVLFASALTFSISTAILGVALLCRRPARTKRAA